MRAFSIFLLIVGLASVAPLANADEACATPALKMAVPQGPYMGVEAELRAALEQPDACELDIVTLMVDGEALATRVMRSGSWAFAEAPTGIRVGLEHEASVVVTTTSAMGAVTTHVFSWKYGLLTPAQESRTEQYITGGFTLWDHGFEPITFDVCEEAACPGEITIPVIVDYEMMTSVGAVVIDSDVDGRKVGIRQTSVTVDFMSTGLHYFGRFETPNVHPLDTLP